MMKLAAMLGLGLLLAVAPAGAAPKVKDQTVATWTTLVGKDRSEHSLTVHGGVLESQEVTHCGFPCPPQGDKSTKSIKLSNVKAFEANSLDDQGGSKVYRIGIEARGAHDMLDKRRSGTNRWSGLPGFAVFASDQKALRDEAYKKLCEMIGQTP